MESVALQGHLAHARRVCPSWWHLQLFLLTAVSKCGVASALRPDAADSVSLPSVM